MKKGVTIFGYLEEATIDADGKGYIMFTKDREESMKNSILKARALKGTSVTIRITQHQER